MDHQGIPWKVFLIQMIHLQTYCSSVPLTHLQTGQVLCAVPGAAWARERAETSGALRECLVSTRLSLVYLFTNSKATGRFLTLFINNCT